MASVTLEHVSKRFGDVVVVQDVSLDVADGEFLVLLGPSGCGKTTTLRMVAGLEAVSEGIVRIGDREAQDLHPADRDVAMVFQNYALYPHMSVFDNMAYGLRRRGVPKPAIDQQVRTTAQLLQIEQLLARRPSQLSGGQRQRVALGRAIVRHPSVFLMDEPLSNLDAKLRVDMRLELTRLHAELGITTMYVTHDQVEAMTMGHRIAVMDGGQVQQVGPPLELYRQPANLFVAAFLGTPGINLIPGTLASDAGALRFRAPGMDIVMDGRIEPASGPELVVGFRAQELRIDAPGPGRIPLGSAVVELVEHLGADSFAMVRHAAGRLVVQVDPDGQHVPGATVALTGNPRGPLVFDSRTGARLSGAAQA